MNKPAITVDLESYRAKLGLSEVDLAEITGIPRSTLRRKLRHPETFTVAEYVKVTNALNIPASALQVAS